MLSATAKSALMTVGDGPGRCFRNGLEVGARFGIDGSAKSPRCCLRLMSRKKWSGKLLSVLAATHPIPEMRFLSSADFGIGPRCLLPGEVLRIHGAGVRHVPLQRRHVQPHHPGPTPIPTHFAKSRLESGCVPKNVPKLPISLPLPRVSRPHVVPWVRARFFLSRARSSCCFRAKFSHARTH